MTPINSFPEDKVLKNPYLLLTPGPLSTSETVRQAMLRDWCTWDDDYNLGVVTPIRKKLAQLASTSSPEAFTSVLLQGSGTFAVEAMLGTAGHADAKLLILANGAYGNRLAQIAKYLKINHLLHNSGELAAPDLSLLEATLDRDQSISHVVLVHNETTTGMLNPLPQVAEIVKHQRRSLLVDAMSSFGGVELDMETLGIDFLVTSANKCLQGVPGFGIVIARKEVLEKCTHQAHSLALDIYNQWLAMEQSNGKWRFTSPTHVVRAFKQALEELEIEGGIPARAKRYRENQSCLVAGMRQQGFECLLPDQLQSSIITAFKSPASPNFTFQSFYDSLKQQGFVIYPGKVTGVDSFRIGTIGHVFPDDITRLLAAVAHSLKNY